jgi:ABC transporter DrrB family efflux protein
MNRVTLRDGISDALVMVQRELVLTVRKPVLLSFSLAQPAIMVLIFRYGFGGAIRTPQASYVNFLLPGILVMTATFGALLTGVGLTEDLSRGIVDRLRALPIARSAVLLGRTLSDVVRNLISMLVMLAIGVLIGFRPSGSVFAVVLALVVILAFAYVFSWISATVALLVRDPETAQGVGFIWVFPLVFVSSAFVPTQSMPAAVRAVAQVNPITLCVNASRALMTGGHAGTALLGTAAWLIGLLLVFVPLAVSRYRALE